MKNIVIIALILFQTLGQGQEALHNFGNIEIHQDGQIGFHGDLINNGDFDTNLGLAGFYNPSQELFILGNNKPIFFDMEVDVINDLNLEVSVGVANFLDFTNGRIVTPREDLGVNLDFGSNAIYLGESDGNHIDGYATIEGNLEFTFPVGDDFKIRQLTVIPIQTQNVLYQAAYFFENPNTPSTLSGSFDTESFENTLSVIDPNEYWDLNGELAARVILTWDEDTDVPFLAEGIESLRVVGYSPFLNRWVDLGNTQVSGDQSNGEITSAVFSPDVFSALTLGSVLRGGGAITVYTGFSPDGDGINDTFIIEGLGSAPANELFIYNRWGVEVFSMRDYDNSFDGTSNGRATVLENNELPEGTYFYVLKLLGQKDLAGFLYIQR